MTTWGTASTECGFGTFYTDADFFVNVTISPEYSGSIFIPFEIYGEGLGAPVHQVSGTVILPVWEFNLYRNGEFYQLVEGLSFLDEELINGNEYCYQVTQIMDGEKYESQISNELCATPNEPPVIEVDPVSLYQVMNPDMELVRTLTITNNTEGPLDLDFTLFDQCDFVEIYVADEGGGETLPVNPNPNTELLSSISTHPIPGDMSATDEEILMYDNGSFTSGLGAGGGTWYVAAYWPAASLTDHIGMALTQVELAIYQVDNVEFTFYVWGQGTASSSGEVLFQQSFDPAYLSWHTLVLDIPLTITGEDIWIGYGMAGPLQTIYPVGGDSGPAVTGFGDMISFDGANWSALSLLNPNLSRNWGIHALLSETGYVPAGESVYIDVIFNSDGYDAGYYTGDIVILSNDLNNPEVIVPVVMEIFQPGLEVEEGLYKNTLTITPIPDEPDGGTDNIEDSYIECQTIEYLAGTTMDLDFYMYHYSPDTEWIDGVGVYFPPGVIVGSASDCGALAYNFETGQDVQVTWGDINGGSGWGPQNGSAYFTG